LIGLYESKLFFVLKKSNFQISIHSFQSCSKANKPTLRHLETTMTHGFFVCPYQTHLINASSTKSPPHTSKAHKIIGEQKTEQLNNNAYSLTPIPCNQKRSGFHRGHFGHNVLPS